jgi:hypothetical protein
MKRENDQMMDASSRQSITEMFWTKVCYFSIDLYTVQRIKQFIEMFHTFVCKF